MRALLRFIPSVFVALTTATLACGKDSSGPRNAASVTGIAGDNQIGPTGGQLAAPLSLVLLGANGQPFAGATVQWSVVAGAATLSPTTSTSDGNGYVATNVTLGGTVGETIVRASTGGVTPVDFHLTVLAPCSYAPTHNIGTTISGSLTALDCNLGNYLYDLFQLQTTSQSAIVLTMSGSFQTYVDFFAVRGNTLYPAGGPVGTGGNDSRFDLIIPAGNYVVGASTLNQSVMGTYTLTSAARAQALTACTDVWTTGGVAISGETTTGDCGVNDVPTGEPYPSDPLEVVAFQGDVVNVTATSSAYAPKVSLYRIAQGGGLTPVTSNTGASTATISYTETLEAAGYVIFVGSSVTGQQGAYTLTMGATHTGAPGATARLLESQRIMSSTSWRPRPGVLRQ